MQACKKCTYFENTHGELTSKVNSGACRINPPSASIQDKVGFWPLVKSHDWCGSFEEKSI